MTDIHAAATTAAVPEVTELPPRTRIGLRVRAGGRDELGAALGVDLPARIGDRARGPAGYEALCLGPDEWVIDAEDGAAGDILARLADRAAAVPHAATDISDREVAFRIAGPGTLSLLAMGCPRDLERLEPGRAARTILHGASVVIRREAPDAVRVDVWRSFAPHLRALLDTGLTELRAGL